jgi:hypothetical protein
MPSRIGAGWWGGVVLGLTAQYLCDLSNCGSASAEADASLLSLRLSCMPAWRSLSPWERALRVACFHGVVRDRVLTASPGMESDWNQQSELLARFWLISLKSVQYLKMSLRLLRVFPIICSIGCQTAVLPVFPSSSLASTHP